MISRLDLSVHPTGLLRDQPARAGGNAGRVCQSAEAAVGVDVEGVDHACARVQYIEELIEAADGLVQRGAAWRTSHALQQGQAAVLGHTVARNLAVVRVSRVGIRPGGCHPASPRLPLWP